MGKDEKPSNLIAARQALKNIQKPTVRTGWSVIDWGVVFFCGFILTYAVPTLIPPGALS